MVPTNKNPIWFLGDIHGMIRVLTGVAQHAYEQNPNITIIQVGDFGWQQSVIRHFEKERNRLPVRVLAICGNHEHHEVLPMDATEPILMAPNLWYVPRGVVVEVEGRRIAFMGGAASIDKGSRLKNGWHWSPLEDITMRQAMRFDGVATPDIFVSHTPPVSVVDKNFNPIDKLQFGVSIDWKDPNADIIETLWQDWGRPLNISGHFHRTVVDENYRILDINEVFEM